MHTFSSDSDDGLQQLHDLLTDQFLDCLYRVERLEERQSELIGDQPLTPMTRLMPLDTPELWESATKLLRERVENLEKNIG